ncbi:MAG: MBL fold metallo-hydrolase, partial [Thermomicrobiales bacterium]
MRSTLRRSAILVSAIALGWASTASARANRETSCDPETSLSARVVLLGTAGGPRINTERSQPATAIVIGTKAYLFDVGYGTLLRLAQAGIPLSSIEAVFITHNHFDHNADLGPLMAFSWHAGRATQLRIYGPPGTLEVIEQALGAFRHSIEIFNSETPRREPLIGRDILVSEGETGAEMFGDATLLVRAAENTHYVHLLPRSVAQGRDKSYSYRVETAAGTVAISGDTGPSEALATVARGADLL